MTSQDAAESKTPNLDELTPGQRRAFVVATARKYGLTAVDAVHVAEEALADHVWLHRRSVVLEAAALLTGGLCTDAGMAGGAVRLCRAVENNATEFRAEGVVPMRPLATCETRPLMGGSEVAGAMRELSRPVV